MTSPFEILGLLPSLVAELDEKQLARVAKEAGRGLQLVFHPDKLGGDAFRSTLINTALATLSNERELGEAKAEYLQSGPGQRELREAESELNTLYLRLAGMDEAIEKGRARTNDMSSRNAVDVDKLRSWVSAIYSDWDGEIVDVIVSMSGSVEKPDKTKPFNAPYLRHLPGARFGLAYPEEQTALESELDMLVSLEEASALGEADNLLVLRRAVSDDSYWIKDYSKKKSKEAAKKKAAYESDLKRKKMDIEHIMKKRDGRRTRIKELRAKLKQPEMSIRKGWIDEDGFIVIEGKRTELRAGGSATFEIVHLDADDFRPLMIVGEYFFGINLEGKAVSLGVLQSVEVPKKEKKRKSVYKKRRKPEEEPEPLPEIMSEDGLPHWGAPPMESTSALVRVSDEIRSSAFRNPLEVLGILPSLAKELSAENLRTYTRMVGKALMSVTHPDAGGNKERFSEINEALETLNDDAVINGAKAAYASTKPAEGRIRELERQGESVKNAITEKIPVLTRAKVEEKKEQDRVMLEEEEIRRFLPLLLADVFTDASAPSGSTDALFLRRCGGMSLAVQDENGKKTYSLAQKAFDMVATEKNNDSFIRLVGSIRRERFRDIEAAREALEALTLADVFLYAQPVIYPKGYLVGIKDYSPEVLGTIESIEKSRAVERKLAKAIDERQAKAPKKPLRKPRG